VKNYRREITKAQKRSINYRLEQGPYEVYYNLLESEMPLQATERLCVFEKGSFDFSLSFLNNVRYGGESEFVVDATRMWFDSLNVGAEYILKRTPSLYMTMYDYLPQRAIATVLDDNPWVFTKFGVINPTVDRSVANSIIGIFGALQKSILTDTSESAIPLGAWGIDIICRRKGSTLTGEFFSEDNPYIIPVEEYRRRIL
jgi:hypothetical protein